MSNFSGDPTDHSIFSTFARNGGAISAVGDYSLSQTDFILEPEGDDVLWVHRVLIFLEDTGSFDSEKYGNGITLTNGISIKVYRGETETMDLMDANPVKTNSHWKRLCYDFSILDEGTGNKTAGARFTIEKGGVSIGLDGSKSDQIRVELNDDFTGLVDHTFIFQGYKRVDAI